MFLNLFLPRLWLDDNTINNYFSMLGKKYSNKNIKCISTFFCELYTRHNNKNAKTMIKDCKDKSLIFIPYFKNHHWFLIVIDCLKKEISSYDSLMSVFKEKQHIYILNQIKNFFSKTNEMFSNYQIKIQQDIKQQQNGNDCGVFVCWYAKMILEENSIIYKRQYIDLCNFRKEIKNPIIF